MLRNFWIKYGIEEIWESDWIAIESTDILSAYDLARERAEVLYDEVKRMEKCTENDIFYDATDIKPRS